MPPPTAAAAIPAKIFIVSVAVIPERTTCRWRPMPLMTLCRRGSGGAGGPVRGGGRNLTTVRWRRSRRPINDRNEKKEPKRHRTLESQIVVARVRSNGNWREAMPMIPPQIRQSGAPPAAAAPPAAPPTRKATCTPAMAARTTPPATARRRTIGRRARIAPRCPRGTAPDRHRRGCGSKSKKVAILCPPWPVPLGSIFPLPASNSKY